MSVLDETSPLTAGQNHLYPSAEPLESKVVTLYDCWQEAKEVPGAPLLITCQLLDSVD